MNKKQKLFINEYLKDFNGSRAYKEVYKCSDDVARRSASRLLTNVDIQEEIKNLSEQRLKELNIDTYYIIKNIKDVTERCMEKEPVQYFDKVDKCWKNVTESVKLPNGDIVEATVMQFDSKNALRGLELLGKYKSIFNENINVKGNMEYAAKQKNAIDDVISQMKPLKEDDT